MDKIPHANFDNIADFLIAVLGVVLQDHTHATIPASCKDHFQV